MRYAARGPDQKRGFAARVSASPHGCLPGWKRWRIQRSPARLRREASELSSPAELRELLLSRAHARTNDLEELWPARDHRDRRDHGSRDGGTGVRRGPRDHHEAIIYMSRATPKNEGAGSSPWLTADWARVRRPPRRPGPWSRRSRKRPRTLSGGVAPRLEFREAGPRFPRQALLRASGPSREMVPTMLVRRGGADREIQTAITPLTPGALTR